MKSLPSSWLAAVVVSALAMGTFNAEPASYNAAAEAEPGTIGAKPAAYQARPGEGRVRRVPRVELGSAYDCAAMGATRILNAGLTQVTGDLAITPGDEVVGFPPGEVRDGGIYIDDPEARETKADAIEAYEDAAGRAANGVMSPELGGKTISPGVYESTDGSFRINGTLTLDAQGDLDALFIFQADSTLNTARVSNIDLVNGAQADNVIWQVGDDATLGTYSTFRGTVLARNSVKVSYGAAIYGRTMALDEALTFEGTEILPATRVTVPQNPPTTTTLTSAPNPSRMGQPVTFTAKVDGNVQGFGPTGMVLFMEGATILGEAYADRTGIATFTTSSLSRGVHEIRAVYVNGGTAVFEAWVEFAPSESPVVAQQVLNRR
ncbi:hypothetical protein GCM10012289_17480 [Nonomuraea cavernae]|uniref:Bacterial Ig-like domain-containing protein n=2 Tax=Nonomuraea cavernae TaxID=2045107 RepID=A0A918DGX9_9ACTN|nr:hypothetical protein GCM10012289_17480 [Nonomuraea cavernae]